MSFDAVSARFPFPKGGYESYYLVAHDLHAPRALWIRYTIHQEPGVAPIGFRWLSWFDGDARPVAGRDRDLPTAGDDAWLRIGEGAIRAREAFGSAGDANWDLRFEPLEALLAYLPSARMYQGALPKTKPLSLSPRVRFSGTVRIGATSHTLDGWEGMVGHNWGSEHASRWVWLHGLFEGGDWIDIVAARVALGPVTTPWIANGALSIDGTRHRLGGMARARSTKIEATPTRARLQLPGDRTVVSAEVRAAAPVHWDYADPHGGAHEVTHSSIASLDLEIRTGQVIKRLSTPFVASYELGLPAGS